MGFRYGITFAVRFSFLFCRRRKEERNETITGLESFGRFPIWHPCRTSAFPRTVQPHPSGDDPAKKGWTAEDHSAENLLWERHGSARHETRHIHGRNSERKRNRFHFHIRHGTRPETGNHSGTGKANSFLPCADGHGMLEIRCKIQFPEKCGHHFHHAGGSLRGGTDGVHRPHHVRRTAGASL